MSKHICSVVFQSHWDREWYFSFETFRDRLFDVMERVVTALEIGELETFVMDGQVVALEDLLEDCEPLLAKRVQAQLSAGRLVIGPWYLLADEFLVSGESLIRNLEIGHRLAAAHDRVQPVGYLPDTFGHIGQMPQLLRGFGIDNAILWRGIDAGASERTWLAPDGSEVLILFLSQGYYQPVLNPDNWQEMLSTYLDQITPCASTPHLLLTQGGDHLMPADVGMQARIDSFNQAQDAVELVQDSYENYLHKVRDTLPAELPQLYGELRDNSQAFVLPNVLSTRTYLKQANQRLEDTLTGFIEPLLAVTPFNGSTYPARYLENTWKLLLKQHPHDSICGCSIDEVHLEMEDRNRRLAQRCDALTQRALTRLGAISKRLYGRTDNAPSPFADHDAFTLFNPLPQPFTGWVRGKIFIQGDAISGLGLTDDQGRQHTPVIVSYTPGGHFVSPLDEAPDMKPGHEVELAVYVDDLKGLSFKHFTVERSTASAAQTRQWQVQPVLENSALRVELCGDTVTVTHKASGRRFDGLLEIISTLDAGDSYTYAPPALDCLSRAHRIADAQVTRQGALQTLRYRLAIKQPTGLSADRRTRSDDQVTSTVVVSLSLLGDSDQLEVDLAIDNRARDQRTLLRLPTGARLSHTVSDTAFELKQRPVVLETQCAVEKNQEAPVSVEPSQSLIGAGALTVLQRGLQEYQVQRDSDQDVLALTLLRSVGWLSRRDLATRGNGAGPDLATPQAQCLGEYRFKLALRFADDDSAERARQAQRWRQGPELLASPGKITSRLPYLQIDNPQLCTSACRRTAQGLELRLWNPTGEPQPLGFDCPHPLRICRVDLLGKPQTELSGQTDTLGPYAIATYRLSWEETTDAN